MASKTLVPGSRVREWANDNGFSMAGRGRLSAEVIEAFHKANKGETYKPTEFKPMVQVSTTRTNPETGRKTPIRKKVNVTEVRAAARAAGVAVSERGRVPQPIMESFVRGDLHTLAGN